VSGENGPVLALDPLLRLLLLVTLAEGGFGMSTIENQV
jgi:hypothetical protein